MMERIRSLVLSSLPWLAVFQSTMPDRPLGSLSLLSILGVIPGESNLKFCTESRDTDLFQIDRVEVHPTPPLV